jgi:hypothetical protein
VKIFSYILSIYLVVLSCLPCADVEASNFTHNLSKIETNSDNHSHDQENDACSPFCICNCCGQSVLSYVPTVVFNFQTSIEEIETLNSIYKSNLYSNFFGSIWQPPQIA